MAPVQVMDGLTIVDWIIIGVVLVSTLISLARGFVREALSLASLVIAVVIARLFADEVSTLLVDYIETPSLRLATAYIGLFLVTIFVGGLVNYAIGKVVEMAGLSGTDRMLGMIFGMARGGLLVVVAVGVLARMPVTEDEWWKESSLIPYLLETANQAQAWVTETTGYDLNSI